MNHSLIPWEESRRFVRNAIHMKNTLYYGDNLEIMRAHIADESVGFIPKLQIRTIKELLEGQEFDFPRGYSLKSGSGKKLVRDTEQPGLEM